MFFNPKKREAKKRLKEEFKQDQAAAKQIGSELDTAQQALESKEESLTKELRGLSPQKEGLFLSLKKGLTKTRAIFTGSIFSLSAQDPIDEDFLEDIEERLLSADMGVPTTMKITEHLQTQVDSGAIKTQSEAVEELKKVIENIMNLGEPQLPQAQVGPTVYLFIGVNGAGKTTTIGKLAAQFKGEGKKVLVAAGDTFRAAAIEQITHWCEQVGVDCIGKTTGSDPSATFFEAATKAKNEGYDVLLCDTSGRLHNKKPLMEELSKMNRSLQKVIPTAPHASMLVIDGNTGQNAIAQAKEFSQIVPLDGLVVTKLDGTAKGGVMIGIVNEFEIPVYYIGVGERVQDLQAFSPQLYAESLLGN